MLTLKAIDRAGRLYFQGNGMKLSSKIFVSGHNGMVGSALVRKLMALGYTNVIVAGRRELDLLDQGAVLAWLKQERPDYVFVAAARVGGIHANNLFRAQFIYENLQIACNLMHGSHLADINQLMFLGSSCIYPRDCAQPIREEYLLTGALEPTNEPYAIAKIAGVKMAEAYRDQYQRKYVSVMPTNLYGPGDNYDLQNSHVLPALIRKAHAAKISGATEFAAWGTGTPRREFLYVDDLADACCFLMGNGYSGSFVNIGCGEDITIRDLAQLVAEVVGFKGAIIFDSNKPDGTPRKLLDVSRMAAMGWTASTKLREGIVKAYQTTNFFKECAA
jgi:GDP-L-fucose synthase